MVDQAIYVIIDGSGSMSGVKYDVVDGINEFIKEQQDDVKGTNDVVHFSLTTFDSQVMEVYINEEISLVAPVTVKDTFMGGGTALLDAIGRTLTKAEDEQAARNIVVIYTDGQENQSREFTHAQVSELIEKLTDTGNWQFIYLGAEFADFHKEAAFGTLVGSAGASLSSLNTGKGAQAVRGTWQNVSATTNYHRHADQATYGTFNTEGVVAAAAASGIADWDAVDESKKVEDESDS